MGVQLFWDPSTGWRIVPIEENPFQWNHNHHPPSSLLEPSSISHQEESSPSRESIGRRDDPFFPFPPSSGFVSPESPPQSPLISFSQSPLLNDQTSQNLSAPFVDLSRPPMGYSPSLSFPSQQSLFLPHSQPHSQKNSLSPILSFENLFLSPEEFPFDFSLFDGFILQNDDDDDVGDSFISSMQDVGGLSSMRDHDAISFLKESPAAALLEPTVQRVDTTKKQLPSLPFVHHCVFIMCGDLASIWALFGFCSGIFDQQHCPYCTIARVDQWLGSSSGPDSVS